MAEGASTAPVAGQEAAEAEDAAPAAEGASAAPVAGQEAAEAEIDVLAYRRELEGRDREDAAP